MTCFFCKGNMSEGVTLHAMQLEKCIVVVKNVPCHICEQCGATVISMTAAKQLEKIAAAYETSVSESEVVEYSQL